MQNFHSELSMTLVILFIPEEKLQCYQLQDETPSQIFPQFVAQIMTRV